MAASALAIASRPPAAAGKPVAIGLCGASKIFSGDGEAVTALSCIDLEVREGEFVSVLGPSGCGKSTLLRIVAGLIPPSEGLVEVYGQRVEGPQENVGIAFQSPVLLPWRTVRRNISLQLEIRRRDIRMYAAKIESLIDLTGLRGFENSRPYQLSGGMQQRVALCRALIHNPSLLLMDEPFGALDAMTREQMNQELQRIWLETQKTVLFITHSITEAVFLSDRVVVMTPRPGRIEEIVSIRLARPRGFEIMRDPEFHTAVERVRGLMNALSMSD